MRHTSSNWSALKIGVVFGILFLVYHLPEFLQNHFLKPLILILEAGMLVVVMLAFYFGRQFYRNGFRIYGLFAVGKHGGNLVKGLLLGILIPLVANLIPVWLGWSRFSLQINRMQLIPQILLFALGTLLPSLAEDILTRGYLRAFWPERWNLLWLVPVSAVVYVLNHIFRLGKPDVMLYLFVLGWLLMWSYYKTGTLWLTLGLHWGANITYQFFANLVENTPIRETGLENYLLAASYLVGFILVFILVRLNFFSLNK